ncbi:hypothetical protein C487_07040 [Natrinema pallidum DSM 3751]|uniref:Uncharacterized protein n=2 Tax=Natrinema pallidum TaxID=69527 RepID=L9YZT1_9EURY|nr:hypothetical protein C487_07040 [Natrinema pallidum DSM 3751]QCW04863.1 hypothetical protein FGF80_17285 [Natrinema pallidum]
MFDEHPSGISRLFEPGIRLARGPLGLVRAFSDTESLDLRPVSADRVDGVECVGPRDRPRRFA